MEESNKKRVRFEDIKKASGIFKYVLPYKFSFIIGSIFLVFSSLTGLIFPYITGKLVDAATGEFQYFENINLIALGLVGVLLLQAIFSYMRVILFANVSEKAMGDIRNDLFKKIIGLPFPFFEERRIGELVSRITADVTQIQDTLSVTLAEFFRQIATLVIGIAIIFITSTKLTLLMLATYPPIVIVAFIFGKYIRKLSKQTQDALADANTVAEESFQSIQTVKSFANEVYESLRFSGEIKQVVGFALKAAKYRAAFISFIIFGLFGGIVLVLWYGAGLVEKGEMTIGDLTAFIIYTTFIGASVGGMGDVYAKIQKTIGSSERIKEILEEESEIEVNSDRKIAKVGLKGKIELKSLSFFYPSRKDITVIKDIDLRIDPGKKLALVGPSGAGKSTIIQLILGYYKDYIGEILFDGRDLKSFQVDALRKEIALVPQEIILFGGSIKENIAYGNPDATEAEIMEAAEKANALEFIESFPEGLETLVGERGVKLSGGQKQRIAIARAILKDPVILILDEATSSLDAESESLVQSALNRLMENRTSIIIAHRLSTIRNADQIAVIENGNIVQQGNHDMLLKDKNGLYANLTQLQISQ
ncbi:MAG: ABC transporter transmembrane domain-containing protein [Chitinophagales bacterium]